MAATGILCIVILLEGLFGFFAFWKTSKNLSFCFLTANVVFSYCMNYVSNELFLVIVGAVYLLSVVMIGVCLGKVARPFTAITLSIIKIATDICCLVSVVEGDGTIVGLILCAISAFAIYKAFALNVDYKKETSYVPYALGFLLFLVILYTPQAIRELPNVSHFQIMIAAVMFGHSIVNALMLSKDPFHNKVFCFAVPYSYVAGWFMYCWLRYYMGIDPSDTAMGFLVLCIAIVNIFRDIETAYFYEKDEAFFRIPCECLFIMTHMIAANVMAPSHRLFKIAAVIARRTYVIYAFLGISCFVSLMMLLFYKQHAERQAHFKAAEEEARKQAYRSQQSRQARSEQKTEEQATNSNTNHSSSSSAGSTQNRNQNQNKNNEKPHYELPKQFADSLKVFGYTEAKFKTISVEELKRDKNKLMRKWHPDQEQNRGSKEKEERATAMTAEINRAYDYLSKYKG